MGIFFSAIKNFSGVFWLPLWTGLLALPLTGPGNALRIALVAVFCVALWRFMQTGYIAGFKRAIVSILARNPFPLSRFSDLVQSASGLVVLVVFLALLPLMLNDYYRDIMTLTCMYIVLALGLNIVVGQAGLLNLGYVAFYAVGA